MTTTDKRVCRKCGAVLTNDNWSVSRRTQGKRICRSCIAADFRRCYAARPISKLLSEAKGRAMKNGVPFFISEAEVIANRICPALGVCIGVRSGFGKGHRPDSLSLDRVMPGHGYTTGNVVTISHRANSIKSNATPDESLAVAIYSYTYSGHSISDIHAKVDEIAKKQAVYAAINAGTMELGRQEPIVPTATKSGDLTIVNHDEAELSPVVK